MCSLCGMLAGEGHWSDSSQSPGAFPNRGKTHTPYRERQERTRIVNGVLSHYGLSVSDWEGRAYLMRSRTGQSALPENLSALWAAAETLLKKPCDPLDDALLERLRPRKGSGSDPSGRP